MDMDYAVPRTFVDPRRKTFQKRRESSPARLKHAAREEKFNQQRLGRAKSFNLNPAQVQENLFNLSLDASTSGVTSSKHNWRPQGFSDYTTPPRSSLPGSRTLPSGAMVNTDASPMDVDASSPEQSIRNEEEASEKWSTCRLWSSRRPDDSDYYGSTVDQESRHPDDFDDRSSYIGSVISSSTGRASYRFPDEVGEIDASKDFPDDDDDDDDRQTDSSTVYSYKSLQRFPLQASDQLSVKGSVKSYRNIQPNRHDKEDLHNLRATLPTQRHSKGKCLAVLCKCSVFIIAVIFISMIVLGFAVQHRQKICLANQQLNVTAMQNQLERDVFGQHLMMDILPGAIEDLLQSDNRRTLYMSFNGWTGIGKTFVSTIISKHIKTPSVHRIVIPMHFPFVEDDDLYSDQIYRWISSNITGCSVSLFIIDEMDKATPGFVHGLARVLEDVKENMNLNSTRVIVAMLSNTGGNAINRLAYKHMESGYDRDQLVASTVVAGLLANSNDDDAQWLHILNSQNLFDHIIPFLPLEREHVIKCIYAYVKSSPIFHLSPTTVDQILDEFSFLPKENPLFSKSGCRKVDSKVRLVANLKSKQEL